MRAPPSTAIYQAGSLRREAFFARTEADRGCRHPRGGRVAGTRGVAIHHRRGIPAALLVSGLRARTGQHRDPLRGRPLELCRLPGQSGAEPAYLHRGQAVTKTADHGGCLHLSERRHQGYAEGDHAGAERTAFLRRPRCDRPQGLSRPRGIVGRSRRHLSCRNRRSRQGRLHLFPARQLLVPAALRSEIPVRLQGDRRRPAKADRRLCRRDQRGA